MRLKRLTFGEGRGRGKGKGREGKGRKGGVGNPCQGFPSPIFGVSLHEFVSVSIWAQKALPEIAKKKK